MRLSRSIAVVVLLGVAVACPSGTTRADDAAATAQLPPALCFTGFRPGDLLSAEEAHAVRASAAGLANQGVVVQFAAIAHRTSGVVQVSGQGGGLVVGLAATAEGVAFQTTGTAVFHGPPEIQGILAATTGAFDGVVAFAGNASVLNVLALPGTFLFELK